MSAPDRLPRRRDIELLANVKATGQDGTARTPCFGNILELGCDALILESKREQRAGDVLILSLVFPGVSHGSNTVVSLGCLVKHVLDPVRLHYRLGIEDLDDAARTQLLEFLSKGS